VTTADTLSAPATKNVPVQAPPSDAESGGWGWLVAATLTRAYLTLMLALLACALLPMAVGMAGSVVQSGSMEPSISPGDIVLTRELPKDAPPPIGRVVTFEAPEGAAVTGLILHRIIAAENDGSLITAGDANAQSDSAPLDRDDIIAQACILVPFIGLPGLWLQNGELLPLAAWILVTLAAIAVQWRATKRQPVHAAIAVPRPRHPLGALSIVLSAAVLAGSAFASSSSLPGVNAAFSDQSGSAGNSWSMAAAVPSVKLAFTTNPAGATGATAFTKQPVVAFLDAAGNPTKDAGSVTLSLTNANGATLSCSTNPVAATSGVATFAGCRINKVGTYTLTARSGALTPATSSTLVVAAGAASALRFSASPSTSTAVATAFATQPAVTLIDAGGNTVTASIAPVSLALTTPSGATLACSTNPKNATSGVATFAGCKVNKVGTYTLKATSGSLTTATSASFTIVAGAPSKLVFTTSPTYGFSGVAFPVQPVVTVHDAFGNTVTTSTAAIALSVTGNPGGTTLTCTANPKSAASGVATFSGCRINKKGTYTLTATLSGVQSATSAVFTVMGG
jgi:signal peptidase I